MSTTCSFEENGKKIEIRRREGFGSHSDCYEVWIDGEYADRTRWEEWQAINAAKELIRVQEAQ